MGLITSRPGLSDIHAESRNISVGGMAFITPVPLNPAEQVAIKLNIPGHSTT
jgi:PilZ domain